MIAAFLAAWKAGSFVKYAERAAILMAVFLAGMALGNVRATRHAIEVAQARSDAQFAEMTNRLAQDVNAANARIRQNIEASRKADDQALGTIRIAARAATRDRDSALAQLAGERALRPIAKEITHASCPDAKPFLWSGDARLVLDRAAGAAPAVRDPAPRNPLAETAGGIAAGAATPTAAAAASAVAE